MLSLLAQVGKSLADLIWPPLCLHCKDPLEQGHPILCQTCLSLLTIIEAQERCPTCFTADFNPKEQSCCHRCREKPPVTDRVAAAFDYEGPAVTLVTQLKYGGHQHLAKGMGAYMAAQFVRLDWPMPDCIIPMPISRLRRMERGFNQSYLIAEALSLILQVPVRDVLKRRSGDYSQAGLNYHQRLQLMQDEAIYVKEGTKLHDQNVLLIDDVMTTGRSLQCSAKALFEAYPKEIYALTFCRAVD